MSSDRYIAGGCTGVAGTGSKPAQTHFREEHVQSQYPMQTTVSCSRTNLVYLIVQLPLTDLESDCTLLNIDSC